MDENIFLNVLYKSINGYSAKHSLTSCLLFMKGTDALTDLNLFLESATSIREKQKKCDGVRERNCERLMENQWEV